MMRFELMRDDDATGVSGTGHVATGCVFKDGVVAMRWLTRVPSTPIYACLADVFHIHGHDGRTRVVPERGHVACSRTMTSHELAWALEDDEGWCLHTLSVTSWNGPVTKIIRHETEKAAREHARQWIASGVMEAGGESFNSWGADQ